MSKKTIKIRIKDAATAKHLKQMARAVNYVWNFCNETSFYALRNHSRWLNAQDLEKLTKGSSKELGLNSTTIQEVCQEYALRRQKSQKRKLRWRGKKSLGWIPFKKTGISFKNGKATYAGHKFKLFQPERLPDVAHGAGEFCEDSRGRWYLCVSIDYEVRAPKVQGEVGIDLGLKSVATLSNGEKVSNGRYYRNDGAQARKGTEREKEKAS
jgi:transposase